MKHTRYLLFLLLLLAGSLRSYGQNQPTTGSLVIVTAAGDSITANYIVTPGTPDNVAIFINPSQGFQLNAHIVDQNGNEVMAISPKAVGGRYVNTFDISSLATGNYNFELYGPNYQGTYHIPFQKN